MNNSKELKDEKPKCNGSKEKNNKKEEEQLHDSKPFKDLRQDLLKLFIECYQIIKDNKLDSKKNTSNKLTQFILELNDEQKISIIKSSKLLSLLSEKFHQKVVDEIDDYVMMTKKEYTKEISKLGREVLLGIAAIFIYHMDEKDKLPNDKDFNKILEQSFKFTKSFNK